MKVLTFKVKKSIFLREVDHVLSDFEVGLEAQVVERRSAQGEAKVDMDRVSLGVDHDVVVVSGQTTCP